MKTMFCISLFLAALLSSAALYAQDAPVTVPSKAQAAKAQPEDAKQKESAPAQSVGGPPMIGVVAVVGSDVIMRVRSSPAAEPASGFGLLKSRRAAVPADLDPASLVKR